MPLRYLGPHESPTNLLEILREDGCIIIKGFLSSRQVQELNSEFDEEINAMKPGTVSHDSFTIDFHGRNTKRLTNLVTISKTFREIILDHDLLHILAHAIFENDSGTYWMNVAEVIEIGPGSEAQPLHRDFETNFPYIAAASSLPELQMNFLFALTEFREENGATRVLPGSHTWTDFRDRGKHTMTVPALLQPGDVLCILGKTVHGGGANVTQDQLRRALLLTFQPGFLTPEEASPLTLDTQLVGRLSRRSQQMLGFRSQYPKGGVGLWQINGEEAAATLWKQDSSNSRLCAKSRTEN